MMNRKEETPQSGYTLAEVTVVIAITSILLLVAFDAIDQAGRTSLFIEQNNDLPVFAQSAVNRIQTEVFQARQIFDGTAGSLGPAYRSALVLSTSYPELANTQWPIFNPTASLVSPDTGTGTSRYAGNALLIARQLKPYYVNLGSGVTAQVDLYRFEYFYLTNQTARSFANTGRYIDIIFAYSATYADLGQMTSSGYTTAQIATICTKLSHQPPPSSDGPPTGPVTKAWQLGGAVATSFYTLNTSGSAPTLISSPTIPMTKSVSMIPALVSGRVSGKMGYTIGFRGATPATSTSSPAPTGAQLQADMTVKEPVPMYAQTDSSLPGFPSGFEVSIAGPPQSRQVFARLVLYSNFSVNRYDAHSATVLTSSSAM